MSQNDDEQPKIKVNGKDVGVLPQPGQPGGKSLAQTLDEQHVSRAEVIRMLDRALVELRVAGQQAEHMGQLLTLLVLREAGGLVDGTGRLIRDEVEILVDQKSAGALAKDRWDFAAEGLPDGRVAVRARRVSDDPTPPAGQQS